MYHRLDFDPKKYFCIADEQNNRQTTGSTVSTFKSQLSQITETQSLTQHEDTQIDYQSEGEASKSPPKLFHEASAMPPPPPQDSPQTELAPRKRRRKRDDPQNCLTNSEVSAHISKSKKKQQIKC